MSGDIPAGWPCAALPADPPSVVDRLTNPSADDLLPQVLQLTPRGAAWGTDEAGDGQGASPVMLQVWRGLAAHAAWNYATEWDLATQALPSAIAWSLPDWENEYGLPDACASGQAGTAQRIAAVRARFGALGGQSPAYFVCLAASLGYAITIDEPTQFHCDDSECIGDNITELWFLCDDGECDDTPLESYELTTLSDEGDELSDQTVWKYWVVNVATLGESWFTVDDGECDFDPLEGFTIATDLECEFRRYAPPHTQLVFDYSSLIS